MKRKRTKLFKRKFSWDGLISVLLFGCAAALVSAALLMAYRSYGHGSLTIAGWAFTALIFMIAGLVIPIRAKKIRPAEEANPTLSIIGLILNIVGLCLILTIYIVGLLV